MLTVRVTSAIIGVLYLILMIYVGGWFFKASVLLMALIVMHEFYLAFENKGHHPYKWMGYLVIILFFYHNQTSVEQDNVWLIVLASIFSLASLVFVRNITIVDIALTVFGVVYPGLMVLFLIDLGNYSPPYNYYLLVFVFFVTWATDTFAYFSGLKYGRRKLCPTISPNKTIEGSIGGLAGSIFIGMLVGWVYKTYYYVNIPLLHVLVVTVLSAIFSQIGDLAASSIKRYCGIKDFGRIFPGHGGLLDRFDSLVFSAPIIYIYYLLFIV